VWQIVRKVGNKETEKYGRKATALWEANGGLKGLDNLYPRTNVKSGVGIYEM